MKLFLKFTLLLGLLAVGRAAPSLAIIKGSTSPDGRLALGYVPSKTGESLEEDEVYLVEAKSQRILQQVPDCASSGGGWGNRDENVTVAWHPSAPYFAVNFRGGRRNWDGRLFRVVADRLELILLPPLTSHPKSKILKILERNSNCGQTLSWDNHAQLRYFAWGYVPKGAWDEVEYARYGLPDFNDTLEFVFEFKLKGSLRLIDLQASK